MFPFRTGVQSTTTEQQVYDSATDGIMTVTGQQYTLPEYKGPTATVQYGTEEEGYPRMLREIEQGELPQFRQEDFPKVGEGVMQPSTPVTQPVEPTPTEPEAPSFDPCPAGFVYDPVKKVCVPIEQPKSDRDTPVAEPRNLTDTAKSLKGNIDFTTGTTADDEKFRAGQYDYEPSRKKIEGFNLFSIGMSALHNLDQFFNEKDAMNKGILVDTTGDGKPDKIDMTQVTRNYQEEEIGLPAGARAFGATESLKAETQYDTAKKLYEEGQLKGTPPTEVKPVVEKVEEETKVDIPTFNILENNAQQFGLLTPTEFGQLVRDAEVANLGIDSANKSLSDIQDIYSQSMQTSDDYNSYIREKRAAERKLQKAQEELAEKNKQIQEEKKKREENIKAMAETNIGRMKDAGASESAMRSVYSAMENTKARDAAQQAYQKAQKKDRGQSAAERQREAQRRTQSVKQDISTGQRIRGGI